MSYLISLDLPLWVAFIPLLLAALLAYKLYQWQGIFLSVKANYQVHLREVQNRLDESVKTIEDLNGKLRNYVSLSEALQMAEQAKIVTEKLYKAEAEAVEREALIEQLNKKIKDLDWLADFNKDLADSYKSISDRQQDSIEQIKADLVAAIAVINRTERGRRQWAKHELKKSSEAVQKAVEKLQSNSTISKTESVVYDSIGVPTVVKADQSENDNGRHDVLAICDEVNRGVKEQAELIKKELARVVDMSQLEVGDSVKFRSGKVYKVEGLSKFHEDSDTPYFINFENNYAGWYRNDGICPITKNVKSKRDIIQIIKNSDV